MGGLFVTMFLALCFGAVVAKSTCSGSTCPDAAKGGNLLQAKRSTVLTQNEGSAFDPEVFALEVALDDRKPFKPQFSPEVTALLAQLHNDSSADDLNPACKRRSFADTKGVSKAVENNVLVMSTAKSHSNSSVSGCPGGQYQLMNFGPSGATKTCCPASSLACAGCASMSGSSCQQCQDGFVSRNGACIACSSGAWFNDQGKSCFHLVPSECNDVKVKGQSSNQACCQCGGGVLTPTPFSYPNVRWALDSEISILPEPRTAQRYTVDAACELSVHNLTMDSATGAISCISGRRKPTEPFSFECEVTAHQTATISTTAVMVVSADFFTYKSSSLLFHTGDVENPILTGSAWSKFELGCAPEISWLSINSNTGTLTYTGSSGSPGGLSVVEDKFFGQDGAVCTVLAWKEGKQYKTTFASIRPRPWPTLQYSSSSVMVTVGEELLPLVPQAVRSHQGLMKPWTYTIACSVSGALPSTKFTYDRILSMGFIDGYEVLEIGEDGQIIVAPESTLSEIFDALSISGSQRKAMIFSCRVFGLFPDPMIDPVETTLTINVQDTMCWVPQTLNQAVAVPDATATSEAQCRSSCRRDPTCANYKFHSNTCNRYDAQSAGGSATTVIAKVTNCTNEGSCVEVQHTKWWLSGIYCPLGRDVDEGRIVYMRGHVTSKDIIYLRESAAASEGCTAGQYILQIPSAGDFMDKSRGIFELRGQVKSCVNSITFAVQPCSTKALAFVEEEEKDEEGLPALILDDPSTAASADFWLHPCECAPSAWGTASPVNPKSFEQVPVDSQNDFIPSPFTIVTGQLVCPSRQLLPGVGVHFQSEEETMEPADCEARCRNHDDCHFFWHGSQHGASTCRLFNGCDNLVREFSLEGSLYAMPRSSSCLMADAERCWATSLRRSFLSMASRGSSGTASTGGAAGANTGGLNLPSNPGNPPSQGMVAWFKSENAGSVWPSSVGNIEGVASVNSAFRTVGAGYGADRAVTYIQGNHRSQFRFGGPGEVLKPTYTICSVTRYTGEIAGATQRKRILQTDKVDWLHGHWNDYSGIAYYQSWVSTDASQLANTKNTMSFDWVVLCGTNGAQRLYELQGSPGTATNIAVNRVINTHPSDSTLYVNGGFGGSETSDFAVMEVITWDRALSDAEMTASVDYLKWKLRVGAVLEVSEHLATEYQKNMDSFGNQNLANVASQTFDVPLANGHRADLSGWTHTKNYARGFLRNTDGTATAVVKSLTPAAKYIYSVYMVHEVSNWQGEAKVSVNHGSISRVYQGAYSIPVLSGVATATPRGEINFEFQRVSHHIHLTAIAIAAVDASVATLQESSQLLELANGAVDSGFLHLHLYQQCDAVLLLGGMGVQECGRPGHRNTTSHEWQHKRPLPKAFQSGAVLLASCWTERYRLLKGSNVVPSERLQCVNGDWINSLGATSLKGLACESCVQVGASGYAAFDERDEQELYFMNRMSLSIYTELGMIKELSTGSKHRYCLSKGTNAEMTVTASASCPAGLLARVTAKSSPENRQFKLIPADFAADADECLESREETDQKVAGLKHLTCNVSAPKQLLLPAELPLDMWNLHILADQRTQDLHKGYSSYCGTSGALSALDFGQLFVGDHQDVTNAASRCKFAPLIQFGDFQDTGILRQKSSSNWNAWHDLLADNPVECKDGEALTGFKLEASQNKYRYECSKIGGLGACFDYYSAQVEVPSFGQAKANWEKPMRMLTVNCGQNSVLGAFHFEFSEGGKWGRVRYQCCKAGGAPVTFDPRGQVGQLMSTFDGTFCPSGRDASDRPMYQAGSQTLTFNRDGGRWCVGTDCSEVTDMATPLGLMTSNWEVVNVSDFNGAFEGQMPKEKNSQSLESILGNLIKPKRPKAPPMPELEEFKAEQPKYAAECLNYQNLWKSVTETFRDDEDNDMEKTDKLLPEPSTEGSELDDYHPCEVAKGAGGVFGSFGGGDGSTAPENMMYADWNNCMQGDINRDLGFAKLDWNGARNGFIWDMVATSAKAFCAAIPDVIVSPFGTGFGLRPSKICEGAVKLQGAARAFAGPSMAYGSAQKRWAMEQEDWNACNPLQVGFARLFCDVHCVRDAVIRGDRSIIRNLEKATKKTNNNMAALVKWSVDSARTETGWIADKIDYANTVSTAYLKEIRTMLQSKSTSLVEGTQVASGMMLKELAGYAEAASFDDLSRITARSALEQFLETPDFTSSSNASEASKILGHLDQLHATLRRVGSRSKEEVFSRQLGRNIKQLQQQAQLQLHTLGVYRLASETSSHQSRAMSRHHSGAMVERHEVMMSIDHIWWTLRKKLDEYLRAAEDEVQSFQASLEEMSSYMDCKKGFKRLIASYTTSMANMKRSHRQLRDAWREGSYLLGELASVIVDTDAFQTFVREQGCKSSYMEQTLKQLDSAVFDMAFLFHRFRASHLPEPDTFALKEATQRIQKAASAVDHCTQ